MATLGGLELHAKAARAVLAMIDDMKRDDLTSTEQNDAIRKLVDSAKLMRIGRGMGVVRHDHTSLSQLARGLCSQMDWKVTKSHTIRALFRHGSKGMKADYLERIGFTKDGLNKRDADVNAQSLRQDTAEEDDMSSSITVKVPRIGSAGTHQESIAFVPGMTVTEYGRLVGCANPLKRESCYGKTGKEYRTFGDIVVCTRCRHALPTKYVPPSPLSTLPQSSDQQTESMHHEASSLGSAVSPDVHEESTMKAPEVEQARPSDDDQRSSFQASATLVFSVPGPGVTTPTTQQLAERNGSSIFQESAVSEANDPINVSSSTAQPGSGTVERPNKRSIDQVEAPMAQDASRRHHTSMDSGRQYKLQRIADEEQNTVELRMGRKQVQKEWANIFHMIQEAVMVFFNSVGADIAVKVAFVPEDEVTELAMLYRAILGEDDWAIFELENDGKLGGYHVLMSLLGNIVMTTMRGADFDVSIFGSDEDDKKQSLVQTLSALGYDAHDIIMRSNYAFVTSDDFSRIHVDPQAAKLALKWTRILYPHLQRIIKQGTKGHHGHISALGRTLESALRTALLLQARLMVVGKYELCWHDSFTKYDRQRMSTLQDGYGADDLVVTMSILPAICKISGESTAEVNCKSIVVCHASPPLDLRNMPKDSQQLRHEEAAQRMQISDSFDGGATPLDMSDGGIVGDRVASTQW